VNAPPVTAPALPSGTRAGVTKGACKSAQPPGPMFTAPGTAGRLQRGSSSVAATVETTPFSSVIAEMTADKNESNTAGDQPDATKAVITTNQDDALAKATPTQSPGTADAEARATLSDKTPNANATTKVSMPTIFRRDKPLRDVIAATFPVRERHDLVAPTVVVIQTRKSSAVASFGTPCEKASIASPAAKTDEAPQVMEPEPVLEVVLHQLPHSHEAQAALGSASQPESNVTAPPVSRSQVRLSPEAPELPRSIAPETTHQQELPVCNNGLAEASRLHTPIGAVQAATGAQPAEIPNHRKSDRPVTDSSVPESLSETEEPVAKSQPQTLRSLALEFTPDGAQDVRVRVTDRGGDVHISLHSLDESLNGRLRDGLHDLVGSLTSAGYDADAWTPGHGHQQQERQQQSKEQYRHPRKSGPEEFGGMFDQTAQENL